MGLVTQRSPAMGAAHECIIRQPGIVDLPDALGFEVGDRLYFRVVGHNVHITRRPALWPDGRYRSAKVRRASGLMRLSPSF
jgi:hypothetical protein